MLYKLVFFFNPNIKELVGFQMTCLEKMYDYNQTRPSQMEKRAELIKEMFAEAGEGCYIEPPFYANWGGRHVHLGNPCPCPSRTSTTMTESITTEIVRLTGIH